MSRNCVMTPWNQAFMAMLGSSSQADSKKCFELLTMPIHSHWIDYYRKSEMPFPLQLNGPRLAQSLYIYLYTYGCILIISDHNHGLAHYAPAHCCSCHTRAYSFSLSSGVSAKKMEPTKSTENPSDILRFPIFIRDSLRAHRRYRLNFSLPAVFCSFCSAEKI